MSDLCMGCMEPLEEQNDTCSLCGYQKETPPLEAFHITPGAILVERYVVGRVLGFGGFGVTYLGYDKTLKKKIAVKEYLPGEFSTRMPSQMKLTIYSGEKREQFITGREQFVDEARRLAKFQHIPEVVHVYDCFEANETAYIVMEFLDGKTLKEKIESEGIMTVEESLPIIFDVLHALEAVHSGDILHRDVSPDNIFITKDGEVKLLDFGAARFATTTHSRSLTVLIKPGFAPEEQYRSRGDQGPWTDVYATAATFYKMITGITPEDALERAVKDNLKEPSKLGVRIGPNTEAALLNALNVKIDGRTQTAKQFEEELLANVVKRIIVKSKKVDIGKWPVWSKVAFVTGGLGLVGFAALIATGIIRFDTATWAGNFVPEGKTRVPNVVNEEIDAAITRGEKANLTVQAYDKQYSSEIPENRVLSQNIRGGTVVEADEVLGVIISAGIEKTYVPNIIGVESEAAITQLKDAGLVVSTEEKEYRAAPGTIGWQSLEGGTETDTGTEIQIIISAGIAGGDTSKQEQVIDLSGMDFDAASDQMLEKYLYLVKRGSEYNNEVPEGFIIRQDLKEGTMIRQNSNIDVVVSLGREMVAVADVQFKSQEEAVQILEASGLVVEIRTEASTSVAEGSVTRQESGGERVEKGTTVAVYVSTGPPARNPVNTRGISNATTPTQRNIQQTQSQQDAPRPQATQPPQPQETSPQPANNSSGDDIWGIIGD